MQHKLAWGLFAFISAMGLLMSTRLFFAPADLVPMLGAASPSVAALSGPESAGLVAFVGRWVATALFGCNLFSLVIVVTALRRGERWAAWAMLYWPLMFLSHLVMYAEGPMRVLQVAWLCLSIPAFVTLLLRSRPPSSQRAPETALA